MALMMFNPNSDRNHDYNPQHQPFQNHQRQSSNAASSISSTQQQDKVVAAPSTINSQSQPKSKNAGSNAIGNGIRGSTTPSNKSPTSTFQPLHSSPLAQARYSQIINQTQGQQTQHQTQQRSLPDGSGIGTYDSNGAAVSALHPTQYPQEEPDHFANSVRKALEEHLSTSTDDGSTRIGENPDSYPIPNQQTINSSSATSPELNSLDSDPSATQRLLPHQRFKTFARDVLTTTQASGPGMALALLYIYKLKSSHPHLKGKEGSEFRIAITALMLSNKSLEDHTFTNKSWSEISGIELKDINKMEVEFWLGLGMKIHASVEEYNQWLATLRSLEERRAHALIKRERDINKRKLAQHHAAVAALQQQQSRQTQSSQSSPQHSLTYPQDHGYPTPPMLPHPVYNSARPGSSSGLLQSSSYSHLPPPSHIGVRTAGLGQQHAQQQRPTSLGTAPSANSSSPFSNFSFSARPSENLDRQEREVSPSYASPVNTSNSQANNAEQPDLYAPFQTRAQMRQNHSAGSSMALTSNSRFSSPEQILSMSRPQLPSHQQLQTPANDSRRQSNASSQSSLSGVKRAFGAMQTGSTSPDYANEEVGDQRSGSAGAPPSKRSAAGLGLLRPGRAGADDWEWVPNSSSAGGTHFNTDSGGDRSNRSSISPTNHLRGHSRQPSLPMTSRSRSSSFGQSQLQPSPVGLIQYPTTRHGVPSHQYQQHTYSLPNPQPQPQFQPDPYPYPNPYSHAQQTSSLENHAQHQQHLPAGASHPQFFHQHQAQDPHFSIQTPNMLVKPYTDYDLNSRPQPTELAFYQISAASSDRRVYGTQPAPPLTEWEYANSRRGSYAGRAVTGIATPVGNAYNFSGQSPLAHLGNTTPIGVSSESGFPLHAPLVYAPHSSPENRLSLSSSIHHQQYQPQPIHKNHFFNHSHQSGINHNQPHPLSRITSPIALSSAPAGDISKQAQDEPERNYDSPKSASAQNRTHRLALFDPNLSVQGRIKHEDDDRQNQDAAERLSSRNDNNDNHHDVFGQAANRNSRC